MRRQDTEKMIAAGKRWRRCLRFGRNLGQMDWISKQCGGNMMYRALIEKKNNQKGNRIFYDCFFAHAFQNEVGEQFDVYIGCSFFVFER